MAAELVRAIGVRALTLNVVNFIVGSAIFVVPATVAADLGASGFLAYLLAALVVLVIALCFAEAGSRVTATGGAYAYVQRAFGPGTGFVVASLLWFANGTLASAAVANALVGTVGSVAPPLGGGLPRALLLLAIYGTFCAVNVRGVEAGSRTVATLTVLKLAPLLLLVVVAVWSIDPHRLVWTGLPAGAALG